MKTAYLAYAEVLEKKARGLLVREKPNAADHLVSVTAHRLSEHEKLRRLGKDLFHDFRETAVGMMENIQEAEEDAIHFWDNISDDLIRDFNELRRK